MKKIKKNTIKLSIIIVVLLLIFVLGIIAVTNPIKYTSFIYRNGLIIFLVGVISIVVAIFLIYLFGRKLLNKNIAFSIDSNGIIDKVNILDYPFIYWENITNIEECKINNVSHLKIFINNPQQYINQKNGFKKWVLNINYKRYETPILLNSTYLVCSFNDFKKDILNSYTEYKRQD